MYRFILAPIKRITRLYECVQSSFVALLHDFSISSSTSSFFYRWAMSLIRWTMNLLTISNMLCLYLNSNFCTRIQLHSSYLHPHVLTLFWLKNLSVWLHVANMFCLLSMYDVLVANVILQYENHSTSMNATSTQFQEIQWFLLECLLR